MLRSCFHLCSDRYQCVENSSEIMPAVNRHQSVTKVLSSSTHFDMSCLSHEDSPTTDASKPPTGIVSTPTCPSVVLQALSARTVAIASCNVLKLKPHRQSIHLFRQGELSVDPTPLKPGGTSDDPGEMVKRLRTVEPVENEPVDVGLRDGATQVTSTLGAVSAVDINGVEVAGSVGTEEPSRATPTTGTPLAETVDLDKKAPVVSTDASKIVLTVGAANMNKYVLSSERKCPNGVMDDAHE